MKNVISSLLMLSVVFCASIAKADNLTVEQAKAIGTYYMAAQTGVDKLTSEQLTLAYTFENPDMDVAAAYVFNVDGCGWIIIAGSSVVAPIIAFSEEGSIDMDNIPENMRWWLTNYVDVIADIQVLDVEKDFPDSEEYTLLVKESSVKGATKDSKIILMSTKWNQGENYYPTYNYYCPQWNNRYCVTGCVATALAQICRYYEYPVQPKGAVSTSFHGQYLRMSLDTVSFDYSLMPNVVKNNTGMDSLLEVAKLCYAVGLAVKMDYDPDGSAANNMDAKDNMRYKFKYERGTVTQRAGDNDTSFINTIRRNLMNNDVVYMSGASSIGSGGDAAGHAWVVCGYRQNDVNLYYMNWGWGGAGNGWFDLVLNNMNISSHGYNFNVRQACIFDMLPPEDSNIHHTHVGINNVEHTILGTAYPNPATLSVSLPYSTKTVGDMQVFSIDGKLVATRRVQPGCGEVELRVDALPQGVYIYRLNSHSGKFIVR